jgi:hypothetical protein
MNKQLIEVQQDSVVPNVSKTIISQADDLAKEHEMFNAHYIIGGRLALYELLSKIYELYKSLTISTDENELLKKMKHKMLHTYNIRVQSNSSDAGVLVRYITRADRKASHIYARVIETALSNEIAVDKFCDYIKKSGGIEHMRSIGANSIKAPYDEELKNTWNKSVWDYCHARELMPIGSFELPEKFQFGKSRNVSYEYYACIKRGGKSLVVANIPADEDFEDRAIKLIGDRLRSMENAESRIQEFCKTAKQTYISNLKKEQPRLHKALNAAQSEGKVD